MKRLKLLIVSGIILIIGVATTLYFFKLVPSVSQRTRPIEFQASEGTEEDPLPHARFNWLRLHDPAMNEIPQDIATKEGGTVEIGRGVIDIPKLLQTLLKIKYAGSASFEFEKDADDPLPGTAESVGYVRGVLTVI